MAFINQDGLLVDTPTPESMAPMQSQALGQVMANSPMPMQSQPGLPMPSAGGPASNIPIPPAQQPQPQSSGPPHVPADPDTRASLWRNLLADFTWSLATGASASAAAPPGQRNMAAFGGALSGPFQRRAGETKLGLEAARQQQLEAAIQNLFDKLGIAQQQVDIEKQKIPIYVQEAMSKIGLNKATAGLTEARTGTEEATRAGKVAAMDAKTALDMSSALSKEIVHIKTPDGGEKVFNLLDLLNGGGTLKPLTETGTDMQVTIPDELARQIGQPELAGKQFGFKVGAELARMATSAVKTYNTGEGVLSRNILTGETTKIGSSPATAYAGARLVSVINPATGLPQLMPAGEAAATGATPGGLSDIEKLTGTAATFSNLHSNVNEVSRLADVVKPGRTTIIASAMATPPTQLRSYLQGALAKQELTPDEYKFINALATLREDITGTRAFFANSPMRSDKQVALMMNQIPDISDIATGSPAMIRAKLDNWMRSIAAVEVKYGPLLSLINNRGAAATGTGTTTGVSGGAAGGPGAAPVVPRSQGAPAATPADTAARIRQLQQRK